VLQCSDYPDPDWQWTGHATITDQTGMVQSCETVVAEDPTTEVSVRNVLADQTSLRISWTAGPSEGYLFRLGRAGDRYSLDYTPAAGGFASLRSHEVRLQLLQPIDASLIDVTGHGRPVPTPAVIKLDCPANAVIYDQTGLIESCEKGNTPDPTDVEIAVANAKGDTTVLRVIWLASTCNLGYEFRFRQAGAGYALDGSLGPGAVCFTMFPQPVEIRLQLVEPVDASTVTPSMTYLHASPSP